MKIPRAAVCATGVCTNLASVFVTQLQNSSSLDPCDDFEAYVCNGFRATHALRPDQGHVTYDNILQDEAEDILRAYLDATTPPIDTPADRANFALLRTAWTSCNDVDAVKKAGAQPIVDLMVKVAQAVPVEESAFASLTAGPKINANDSKLLADVQIALKQIGIDVIVSLGPTVDDKNPDRRIISLSPPSSIALAKNYYKDNATLANYQTVMAQVLAAIHPSAAARANAASLAADVAALESKLSALLPELSDLGDVTIYYNLLPYADAVKLSPLLGLDALTSAFVSSDYELVGKQVMASFPEYFGNVTAALLGTPRATLQTFFMWQLVLTHHTDVISDAVLPYTNFTNQLQGRLALPERWRFCQNYIFDVDSLGWILSRFYVADHFSEAARELGVAVVNSVREQYVKTISALAWMDDVVKQGSIAKLNKMTEKIGFPTQNPNISDPTSVQAFYANITLTPDSYFANLVTLTKWYQSKTWARLPEPVDKDEWEMASHIVNAYYDPTKNTIVFPAAIMQSPYFHVDLPAYINFGAWGATVGHETSHGFDDNGRNYDGDGRFVPDWWTPKTAQGFEDRSQCFVKEYDNYTVTGLDGATPLHLSGDNTLGENIADAGGLDASYLAWKSYVAAHPEADAEMPGLSRFTHEQLFFISYANSWCSKYTTSNLVDRVFRDVHAPAPFRVTGPVANSPWFRQAWGCKVKEPTCKLW